MYLQKISEMSQRVNFLEQEKIILEQSLEQTNQVNDDMEKSMLKYDEYFKEYEDKVDKL